MKKYDVTGIGSPLVDFTVQVGDDFLVEFNLVKGQSHLIDHNKSKIFFDKLKNTEVTSSPGGSSANTLAGLSCLGGSGVFLGKIGLDKHGEFYEQATIEGGIIPKLSKHESEFTGHAITFITPDSERSFAVHLGAALHFRKEDVLEEDIANSKILHLEAYQLEDKFLKETILHAVNIAKKHDVKISLDLGDAGLIKRNLNDFKNFVGAHVDYLFFNENEALAFTGKTEVDALKEASNYCNFIALKLGDKGSLILHDKKFYEFPRFPVKVQNTNGAGDMYVAGILYSLCHDVPIAKAGFLASYAAAQVVATPYARLNYKINIKDFLKKLK